MKVFAIFAVVLFVAVSAEEQCYKNVKDVCHQPSDKTRPIEADLTKCSASYGAIKAVEPDLHKFANTHIQRSFEFLMMSTHYANYEKNREGFEKLFRGLSDSTWNDAIDLIKYITKRGGSMDFNNRKVESAAEDKDYELYEMQSMAKALDIVKHLAVDAHKIHGEATRNRAESHDPEISAYIEEEFVHKHAKTIRELSGHTYDLKKLLSGPDSSLALYLFDEYLQK